MSVDCVIILVLRVQGAMEPTSVSRVISIMSLGICPVVPVTVSMGIITTLTLCVHYATLPAKPVTVARQMTAQPVMTPNSED